MGNVKEISMTLRMNDKGEECLQTIVNNLKFEINFTSADQTKLRNLFLNCFIEGKKEKFIFKLIKDDTVKNTMIQKVSSDYVDQLNTEMSNVFSDIKEALSQNK